MYEQINNQVIYFGSETKIQQLRAMHCKTSCATKLEMLVIHVKCTVGNLYIRYQREQYDTAAAAAEMPAFKYNESIKGKKPPRSKLFCGSLCKFFFLTWCSCIAHQ